MNKTNNYFHHDEHHHGQGRGHGRGLGAGHHHDHDHHHDHQHGSRNGGGGFGPTGYCICIKCGYKTEHQRGVKCTTLKCPECGHVLARKELLDEKRKK